MKRYQIKYQNVLHFKLIVHVMHDHSFRNIFKYKMFQIFKYNFAYRPYVNCHLIDFWIEFLIKKT